ncbi:MAG TPA: hypothetical protein VL359_17700 [bacterium]|nr:hypothetical protein [bacterium]
MAEALNPPPAALRSVAVVLSFALGGWAFCAAIMAALPPLVGMDAALLIHLLAGPLAFAALSWAYQRRFHHYAPATVAAAFVALVITLDALLVALLILKSFDMFRSAIGTWIPFLLIFLSSWGAGRWARKAHAHAG